MRPIWLIEAGVYGADADPLLAEIRRQGMTAEVVSYQAVKTGAVPVVGGQPLETGACVIGYGTFPFARQIQLHQPWMPGAWCSPDALDCSVYYAHFGPYLLNQTYVMMPGVEAIRQRDWVFSALGRDDSVFVRPTGCHKLFVGRCVDRDTFPMALAPTRYDPATLVVVASPKSIVREWRLVVAGDHVVTGSQYAEGGERAIMAGCPAEVVEFAGGILSQVRWRPDPIFMLDVGESEGRLWLVELNGFSCSWLYRCDLHEIVATAAKIAEQEWQQGDSDSG